jgi:inorganic pyrophosphatase
MKRFQFSKELSMQKTNYPQEAVSFQVQAYRKPKDIRILRLENVSFAGSPRKHPYDPEKIILVADPYSTNTYYDPRRTICSLRVASVVDMDGITLTMIRMWVRKGSIAVRSMPFIAGDTQVRE